MHTWRNWRLRISGIGLLIVIAARKCHEILMAKSELSIPPYETAPKDWLTLQFSYYLELGWISFTSFFTQSLQKGGWISIWNSSGFDIPDKRHLKDKSLLKSTPIWKKNPPFYCPLPCPFWQTDTTFTISFHLNPAIFLPFNIYIQTHTICVIGSLNFFGFN